jgi:hypothetical protein
MAFLGCLTGLAVLAAMAFGAWYPYRWVMGPVDRAAKNRQYAVQFNLADLFCLFVLVQLPAGIVHWAAQGAKVVYVADVLIGVLATALWWTCMRTLSRAGIHVIWHRCVVLCVALPVTIVGGLAVVFLFFGGLQILVEAHRSVGYWMLLANVPLIAILYGLGRFTRFIVASAEARRSERPPVPAE